MWAAHGGVCAEGVGHVLGELEREREIPWVSDGPFGQGLKRLEGCGPVREQHEARGGAVCPGVESSRCGHRRRGGKPRGLEFEPKATWMLSVGWGNFSVHLLE